jgi:hypothetical protein
MFYMSLIFFLIYEYLFPEKDLEQKPVYAGSGNGSERKLMSSDSLHKGGANTRGGRSERGNFSQSKGSGGNRGGGKGGRGGRGGAPWSGSDTKDRGNNYSNYHHTSATHRDDRTDKGRHSAAAAGGSTGASSMQQQQQQQKPPRFQNQQRYQQQAVSESPYGRQNWSSSYNESNYGGTWPGRNTAPDSGATKSRDNFGAPSHQESYGTVSYSDRNKCTRQQHMESGGYRNNFDSSLDSQTDHGPEGHYGGVGNIQNFGQQQQNIPFNSVTKFSNERSVSVSHDTFNSYPRTQNHQNNQMYAMDFSFKDTSCSLSNMNSPPSYGSSVYSSNASYGGIVPSDGLPSNQYIPDSKSWQWHKGDKCMAKYWEDNMVSRVIENPLALCLNMHLEP